MWEAFSNIFTSPGGWQVLLTAIVIVLMLVIMAKAGLLRVHTKFVSLGESYDRGKKVNQKVVRRQIEYAEGFCTNLLADIYQMFPEQAFGGWKTRCILEQIYDEIIKWISFNHITESDTYIGNKCVVIRAIVMRNEPADFFKTQEFEARIREWVTTMIRQLVMIREETYREEENKK